MSIPKVNSNSILPIAAVVVVFMAIMAYVTYYKNLPVKTSYKKDIIQIQTQSNSNDINSIEKDLMDTNLGSLDSELDEIEKELETAY
jgi:hypothetical protein